MPFRLDLIKIPSLLAAAALFAAVASGCGASSSAEITGGFQDRGRQLFNAKCGTCHVMAAAASQAVQAPNLDTAFGAARAAGMSEDTVKSVVEYQIYHPRPSTDGYPGVSMPANIVTGNDAEDVAAYVARYAGVPGPKPPKAPGEGPGAQVYANNGCGSCHIFAAAQSASKVLRRRATTSGASDSMPSSRRRSKALRSMFIEPVWA